jgi:hypothetical protein
VSWPTDQTRKTWRWTMSKIKNTEHETQPGKRQ